MTYSETCAMAHKWAYAPNIGDVVWVEWSSDTPEHDGLYDVFRRQTIKQAMQARFRDGGWVILGDHGKVLHKMSWEKYGGSPERIYYRDGTAIKGAEHNFIDTQFLQPVPNIFRAADLTL